MKFKGVNSYKIVYFHDLNKKEIDEIKELITEANKTGFLAGVDSSARDHITNCETCEKKLLIFCHKIADVVVSKKFTKLADNMTYQIETHSGLKIDQHCSIESIRKNCSCIQHELDDEHCCNCHPENCIKRKQ